MRSDKQEFIGHVMWLTFHPGAVGDNGTVEVFGTAAPGVWRAGG